MTTPIKIVCSALSITAIAVCAYLFQHNASAIIHWTNTLGFMAPVFFLLLYCIATLLFLPTMVLTLAGGALFGPIVGTLFNLLGATLGAACAFCISRYVAFDWLASKNNVRLNKMIAGVEGRGWQFVALLRLVPIIPFNLVNYGLGVTGIKFSHYLLATLVFLIPTEIMFTYCGYAGMDILTHPEEFYKGSSFVALPCLAIILILYARVKRRRRHLIIP